MVVSLRTRTAVSVLSFLPTLAVIQLIGSDVSVTHPTLPVPHPVPVTQEIAAQEAEGLTCVDTPTLAEVVIVVGTDGEVTSVSLTRALEISAAGQGTARAWCNPA